MDAGPGTQRWRKRLQRLAVTSVGVLVSASLIGSFASWIATRHGFSRHPEPGTLFEVGGHRLHLHCTGERGSPTVLFESALGGWSIDWTQVQALLPSSVRACAYDRAGYGWSDPSGRRTTPAEVADDLAVLLDASGEPGPYVLVGHSLGGIYARQFAHRHPDKVAGLVMVDSSHEEILRRFPADSPVVQRTEQLGLLRFARYLSVTGITRLLRMPVASHPDLPEAQQEIASAIGYRFASYHAFYNEAAAFTSASRDPDFTIPSLPEVPMIVLASRENLEDPDTGPIALELQHELVAAIPGSTMNVIDAGHFIHTEQPDAVVDAIETVLAEVETP